jgi:hypothetical protein
VIVGLRFLILGVLGFFKKMAQKQVYKSHSRMSGYVTFESP